MASARCVQNDSWKKSRNFSGEKALWTGQVVSLATSSLQGPECISRSSPSQNLSAAICARFEVCKSHGLILVSRKRRQKAGRDFILETRLQGHTLWSDKRRQRINLSFPDVRNLSPGDALWLDNSDKPAWVNAWMDYSGPSASPWSLSLVYADKVTCPGFAKLSTLTSVKKLCQQGQVKEAVDVLEVLVGENAGIDKYLFYSVLKECVVKKDLMLGGHVHALAVKMGFGADTLLCNHFIRMYADHGRLREAMDVFRGVAMPDAYMWSSIITAHVKQGQAERAIQLYQHLRDTRVKPDGYVLVAALQACAAAGDLQSGRQVHNDVFASGMEHDIFVCCCLVGMYAKCGSVKDARRVFDGLSDKNVVTWNAMIAGYAQQEGMAQQALSLYSAMQSEGVATPNAVTFVCVLQACANVGVSALEKGKQLHSQLKGKRLESDVVVGGSLVNMYAKCGSLIDARIVFDRLGQKNVVTWNAMMSGYAQQEGMSREALKIYSAMCSEGMAAPNAVTYSCLLQACANLGLSALETGKQLHSHLKDHQFESDVVVGCSLVNMYVRCGSLKDARIVFDGLRDKNVVTWTAMISGYAQQEGMGQDALNIYSAMRSEGMSSPNAVTYVCLLEACASVGALQQGKQLHSEIREGGYECNILVGNCLVKMYAKCGRLAVARDVFDRLPVKDVVTWNSLLKGYAEHGEGDMAIQCFEELSEQGIPPNEVTYTCLFAACSHAGLVDQGQQYFESMVERHGIEPNDWHYNCMVDLLGRSGHLDRAEQMLRASSLAGDGLSWTSLLTACKSFGDVKTGRRCFDHLVKLEPTVATAYVLLSGIYANAGSWDEADRVESLRKISGIQKVPAKACIEVKEKVHEFTVGEKRSDVAASLRKMITSVTDDGHLPQTQLVLRAVSEQEKEDALCGHAEKLALAYGLLHTPAGSPLVVTKNLRMCSDCHSSTKIMSRLEKREIVVRDLHKVHRFQDGGCSCQDRP